MLHTLHPALLDRMEIIDVSGYTFQEKQKILETYLVPAAIKRAGLNPEIHSFNVTQEAKD